MVVVLLEQMHTRALGLNAQSLYFNRIHRDRWFLVLEFGFWIKISFGLTLCSWLAMQISQCASYFRRLHKIQTEKAHYFSINPSDVAINNSIF